MKILIIRNDKLGDFILSYPVYSLVKDNISSSEIHVLVPGYTSEMAKLYSNIDKVLLDPGPKAPIAKQIKLLREIRINKYDAIITLYSTTRIGLMCFLSGCTYRLAPATKIAQLFYNHKLTQRRSKSLKPEYEYNLDLAKQFLSDFRYKASNIPQPPFLNFSDNELMKIRRQFFDELQLAHNLKLIYIHPGTGGSATNLDLTQYATLAKNLNINESYTFVITAGPDEIEYANKLSTLLGDIPHVIYLSSKGLVHFTKIIQLCELFISGSTGPLHIAGALNRPTAAFYQRRRSATPLRWQTLNSAERRLAFTPPVHAGESDMQQIDVKAAAKEINSKYLSAD